MISAAFPLQCETQPQIQFRASRSILVSCIVDRFLVSILLGKIFFDFGSQRCLLHLVDLFKINVFEVDDLFDVLWHWRCSAPSPRPQMGKSFVVGLLLFSDSGNSDFVVFLEHNRVLFKFVLALRRLLGCLGVWSLENHLVYRWELHSVLAQLTPKHLSSQQGTVTLFSMYCI